MAWACWSQQEGCDWSGVGVWVLQQAWGAAAGDGAARSGHAQAAVLAMARQARAKRSQWSMRVTFFSLGRERRVSNGRIDAIGGSGDFWRFAFGGGGGYCFQRLQ